MMKKKHWITGLLSALVVFLIMEGHKHFVWVMPLFVLIVALAIYFDEPSKKRTKSIESK